MPPVLPMALCTKILPANRNVVLLGYLELGKNIKVLVDSFENFVVDKWGKKLVFSSIPVLSVNELNICMPIKGILVTGKYREGNFRRNTY